MQTVLLEGLVRRKFNRGGEEDEMSSIFHNKTAEDGYTRFWLFFGPLFTLPLIVILVLVWRELRRIANKI